MMSIQCSGSIPLPDGSKSTQEPLPSTINMTGMAGIEIRFGSLVFTSKFDSGNLARVEKVVRDDDCDSDIASVFPNPEPRADSEFNIWTKADCGGTQYENGNRSWFYFGIRGGTPGRVVRINVMNLNRQGKLYAQGHVPMTKTVPGRPKWERLRDRPQYETVEGQFYLGFTHRFHEFRNATVYFAFCFPWSYTESQDRLSHYDKEFGDCQMLTAKSPPDSIYYHRELLCNSLDGRRIDLITVTDSHGMLDEEPRFDPKLFPDLETPRCKSFHGKRVYFLSSRVHPGETPASFVFNGFLEFILRRDDPRSKQLRKQYVFKLIPMLNPDGVSRGHYRTDSRGMNLNRVYLDPNFSVHPSIYASKAVMVYHHVHNRIYLNKDNNCNKEAENSTEQQTPDMLSRKEMSFQSLRSQSNDSPPSQRSQTINVTYRENGPNTETVVCTTGNNQESLVHNPLLTESRKMAADQLNHSIASKKADQLLQQELSKLSIDGAWGFNGASTPSEGQTSVEQPSVEQPLETVQLSTEDATPVVLDGVPSDEDDNSEKIGNEGSDLEDGPVPGTVGQGKHAPHLSDPKLLEISPKESGIAFYVDLHGHASKRGCFIYGNYYENEDTQVENMLYPRLISVNTAHFDFTGCNFTERNMYSKDRKDGMSKEGSGRVGLFKAIGIVHSYTLECNYNTGRMVNCVPAAYGDNGRATPPPLAGFPPKYTIHHFEEVGKALCVAALDMTETNPWSRLVLSEHNSLYGIRDSVRRYLRGLRGLPKGPVNRTQPVPMKNNYRQTLGRSSSGIQGGPGFMPRVALLASQRAAANAAANQSNASTSPEKPSLVHRKSITNATNNMQRQLGPVRDPPKAVAERAKRRLSTSSVHMSAMTQNSTAQNSNTQNSNTHQSSSAPNSGHYSTQESTGTNTIQHWNPDGSTTVVFNTASMTDFNALVNTGSRRETDMNTLVNSALVNSAARKEHVFASPMAFNNGLNDGRNEPRNSRAGFRGSSGCSGVSGRATRTPHLTLHTQTGGRAIMRTMLNNCSDEHRPGSEALVDIADHQDALLSDDGSTYSLEQEKLQQLKNIPSYSVKHKPPTRLTDNKTLEPPKSDPPKRKVKRLSTLKKRSSSHSPKSGKGLRKAMSSGTDSEVEKRKTLRTRRKSSLPVKSALQSTTESDSDVAPKPPKISPRAIINDLEQHRNIILTAMAPPTTTLYTNQDLDTPSFSANQEEGHSNLMQPRSAIGVNLSNNLLKQKSGLNNRANRKKRFKFMEKRTKDQSNEDEMLSKFQRNDEHRPTSDATSSNTPDRFWVDL